MLKDMVVQFFSLLNLGPPSCTCRYCGALFWYEERINRRQDTMSPSYNKCCKEGSVFLPPYRPPREPLYNLLTGANPTLSRHFFENIRIFGTPDKHGDIFSAPVASEVVGLVVDDFGASEVGRDLIVEDHAGQLCRVNENHCKFMAMQYPILFPYGEDGFHENIFYRQCRRSKSIKRKHVTMLECFAYRLHDRVDDFNTPKRCKRLTQSCIVEAYCCVEESRLSHYRKKSFQSKYRSASFKEIREVVARGVIDGSDAGQIVILPSSFIGGPRYWYQNYLDCVALCAKYGCPDLFITFTSNPLWSEVTEALALIPGQHPSDRADIVDHVFHMKLEILMDDITKGEFFGPLLQCKIPRENCSGCCILWNSCIVASRWTHTSFSV
ncbi:hypothetical protein QOZ80_2AG0120010 [Eleusine coracana subsp. coracana]|nr:hypothetical protein QOZ80_2AG0120010 [Eleusine coracana subsp. coracana]